jgi:hypothetical protein
LRCLQIRMANCTFIVMHCHHHPSSPHQPHFPGPNLAQFLSNLCHLEVILALFLMLFHRMSFVFDQTSLLLRYHGFCVNSLLPGFAVNGVHCRLHSLINWTQSPPFLVVAPKCCLSCITSQHLHQLLEISPTCLSLGTGPCWPWKEFKGETLAV